MAAELVGVIPLLLSCACGGIDAKLLLPFGIIIGNVMPLVAICGGSASFLDDNDDDDNDEMGAVVSDDDDNDDDDESVGGVELNGDATIVVTSQLDDDDDEVDDDGEELECPLLMLELELDGDEALLLRLEFRLLAGLATEEVGDAVVEAIVQPFVITSNVVGLRMTVLLLCSLELVLVHAAVECSDSSSSASKC